MTVREHNGAPRGGVNKTAHTSALHLVSETHGLVAETQSSMNVNLHFSRQGKKAGLDKLRDVERVMPNGSQGPQRV